MSEDRDEDLTLDDQAEDQNPDNQDEDAEGQQAEAETEADDDDDGGLTITIEGAEAEAPLPEPDLIKHLRGELRKRDAEIATIRRAEPVAKIELGPKPTLESCEYDEAKYEASLETWKDDERKAKTQEAEAQGDRQQQQEAYAADWADFARQKASLKVADFDETEDVVAEALSAIQSQVIVLAATDKAKVVYALGKHPAKLKELAAIKDPIKFAASIARLEGNLKVTQRKRGVEPEEVVKGSASVSGTDRKMESLEREADRTGDRTKVIQYKRELKRKK